MFNNAALLDAETMTLTYQKILNEEKGVIAAKDITIDADHLDNKNRIEAQNLLDITAKNEAHNHENSYLKAEGDVDIKATLLSNNHLIQARKKLSITKNELLTNVGKLLSQWIVNNDNKIVQLDKVLPEVYLIINTQRLDNRGQIYGASLDIDTRIDLQGKKLLDANPDYSDCSIGLGQIKALHDLKLSGAIFNNKTVLAAETMNFTFQKMTNENAGWVDASKSIEIKAKNVDNKNVIQSGGTLSIEENDELANTGWLISQGSLDENSNVLPVKDVLPKVYLKVETRKLDNKGQIFGVNLDINTRRILIDENGKNIIEIFNPLDPDCSNGLGQIKALHDLILKGEMFNNAALLDAETMTLTYQKILNEEKVLLQLKTLQLRQII